MSNRSRLAADLRLGSESPDREVLSEAISRLGSVLAARLEGTVSFVHCDPGASRLLAVADRGSQNRLYYRHFRTRILVGPSARAIAERSGEIYPEPWAIGPFLNECRYSIEHGFYRGVRILKPGWQLIAEGEDWRVEPYWQLRLSRKPRLADEEYLEQLTELLPDVVDTYLPRDRFGISLSGGLDSGAVACLAVRARSPREVVALRAVTPGLPEADEGKLSSETSNFLGLSDRPVDTSDSWPMSASVQATLEDTPQRSYYPEWLDAMLAAAESEGISCVLTGFGGDNLFGGHVLPYADLLVSGRWLKLSRRLSEHADGSGRRLAWLLWKHAVRPLVSPLGRGWKRARWRGVPWLGSALAASVDPHEAVPRRIWSLAPGRDTRFRYLDHGILSDASSIVADLAARRKIEFRNPLWDYRLREFAMALPTELSYRYPLNKWIFKRVLRGHLPESVVNGQPAGSIFELGKLGLRDRGVAKIRALMTNMRAAEWGFIEPEPLRRKYEDFVEGRHDDASFWHAICLELWLREHF